MEAVTKLVAVVLEEEGGGLAAAYVNISAYPPPYNLTVGTGGVPGQLQESNSLGGYSGSAGNASSVKYATNTVLLVANGGNGGNGGPDPDARNESVSGVTGGTGSVLAGYPDIKYTNTGNSSNASGNKSGSDGGTYFISALVPQISNNVSVSNDDCYNRPYISNWSNLIAGYGQGGHGGINDTKDGNNRGNAGQPGGNGVIRAYFIK
jgi:hypothetical protein